MHTEQNDDDKLKNKGNVWNIDTSPDIYAPEFTNAPIKDRPKVNSSRKNTQAEISIIWQVSIRYSNQQSVNQDEEEIAKNNQ